ncbi:hypothetical protein Prudu_009681 [Prunus dulcis]|uniref:Uncharacterized protein n=1 Tax=Prunus dulcis TaxID=3755 RepID=A0A4Y1R6S5_PRUDU|nr:hypothetical protein Prudu_009681 [Prunus dulcis]
MERFLFCVKALLHTTSNGSSFWMGNLKHKDLKGQVVSSQVYVDSEDDHVDEEPAEAADEEPAEAGGEEPAEAADEEPAAASDEEQAEADDEEQAELLMKSQLKLRMKSKLKLLMIIHLTSKNCPGFW